MTEERFMEVFKGVSKENKDIIETQAKEVSDNIEGWTRKYATSAIEDVLQDGWSKHALKCIDEPEEDFQDCIRDAQKVMNQEIYSRVIESLFNSIKKTMVCRMDLLKPFKH